MTEETNEEFNVEEVEAALPAETAPELTDPVVAEIAAVVSPQKERGIKETLEVLKALDLLGDFVAKLFADGQVNSADFVHIVSLIKDFDSFSDAVSDADMISDELKDLSSDEVMELGMKAYNIVKKIVKATKSKK